MMNKLRLRALLRERVLRHSAQQIFAGMYQRNSWGDPQSVSGHGSDLVQTQVIRRELAKLVEDLGVRTLLDAPCGDFYWMRLVELQLAEYIGADIVPDLIAANTRQCGRPSVRFVVLDVCKDELPKVDLILCRDCLVHLPLQAALAAVHNFVRSGSRYLLTTTFPGLVKRNKPLVITGNWRPLDLRLPPFSFPEPLRYINEECTEPGHFEQKSLGLWELARLRRDG
jgi:SAM-dependent methyltransferase